MRPQKAVESGNSLQETVSARQKASRTGRANCGQLRVWGLDVTESQEGTNVFSAFCFYYYSSFLLSRAFGFIVILFLPLDLPLHLSRRYQRFPFRVVQATG